MASYEQVGGNLYAFKESPSIKARAITEADKLYRKGQQAEAQDNMSEALDFYRQATELDPDDYYSWSCIGTIQYRRLKFQEAETSFREAVRIRPDDSEARFNLACVLEERGCLPEAVKSYQAALRCSPNHAFAHYRLGFLYFNRGEYAKALTHLEAYFGLDQDHPGWRLNAKRAIEAAKRSLLCQNSERQGQATPPGRRLILIRRNNQMPV